MYVYTAIASSVRLSSRLLRSNIHHRPVTSSSSSPRRLIVAYRSIEYCQHYATQLFASPRLDRHRARLHGPYAPLHPSIHHHHRTRRRPIISTPHSSVQHRTLPVHRDQILPTAKRADKPSRPRNRLEPVCPTQAVCLPNPGTSLPLLQVSQPLCDLHSAIQAPWDLIC